MQTEMANSSPSFGYSILSQLLETQHNVVITTNFDSLVEDALFLYSKYKPLVCGHESLSEFVKPVNARPVIIKVHRDLLLHPKNEDGELLKLEEGFANSLDRIFQGFTPIVIGYAGNDLSLMNYMNGCNSIKNIFWCRRTGDVLSPEINKLLETKNGKVFDIAGFDELMFQIYAELYKAKELDKRVKEEAEKKANEWGKQLLVLSKGFTDKESQNSLFKVAKNLKINDWWDVEIAADLEKDIEIKNSIYLLTLRKIL
jgi:protein O-mannosyl-transferase